MEQMKKVRTIGFNPPCSMCNDKGWKRGCPKCGRVDKEKTGPDIPYPYD